MCVTCKIPLDGRRVAAGRPRARIHPELIDKGEDEAQIKRALVAQYGPAVLGLPAPTASTWPPTSSRWPSCSRCSRRVIAAAAALAPPRARARPSAPPVRRRSAPPTPPGSTRTSRASTDAARLAAAAGATPPLPLHLIRRAHPEQPQAARDHAPRWPRTGRCRKRLHRLRLGADHVAVAVEGGERLRQLQRVGGDAMRRAALGRLVELGGERQQLLDQRALGRVQRLRSASRGAARRAARRARARPPPSRASRRCARARTGRSRRGSRWTARARGPGRGRRSCRASAPAGTSGRRPRRSPPPARPASRTRPRALTSARARPSCTRCTSCMISSSSSSGSPPSAS